MIQLGPATTRSSSETAARSTTTTPTPLQPTTTMLTLMQAIVSQQAQLQKALSQQVTAWQQLAQVLEGRHAVTHGMVNADTSWHAGTMVLGAEHMGRLVLNPTTIDAETLCDDFTICLPCKRMVTGLFLRVEWPLLDNVKSVCGANFVVEVDGHLDGALVWRQVATVTPCPYGLRINTEDKPWHTERVRVRFERRPPCGNPVLDKFQLKASNLIVRTQHARV